MSLVVQGNDGTQDWFYSKQITGTETINASDIKSALSMTSDIDLSACKIWLEITEDNVSYAVNIEDEIEKINTTYVTRDELMTAFKPEADGTATNYGKLVFGKKLDGTTQEWYILGADSGVSGDNTIIFAASPIATVQKFDSSSTNKTDSNLWSECNYGGASVTEVFANHYGASELRAVLKGMTDGSNTSCFTTAEQGLMNDTTVTTTDKKNRKTYTTTDKLYALAADGAGDSYKIIKAGSDNRTVLAIRNYCNSGEGFWMRSPNDSFSYASLYAWPGHKVNYNDVYTYAAVQPASNLKLSSVLFASAAMATSSVETYGMITEGQPMILRLDGTSKDIGTVTYNTTTGNIKAVKGGISQSVELVVQGNGGTHDWFYSKTIGTSETINTSTIKSKVGSDIDLSACKIWLETTDSTENLTYAVNATEAATNNITSVAITDIDTPAANTALDTSASCTTTGVSSTTPQITWTPNDTTAGYNTSYTASITLTADTDYEFTDSTTATVLGNSATSVTKNADGTLTVTYAFPATAKDKLTSITAPQAITVANGTAYDAMNLPATVNIVTEGNTASSAQVTWDTTTPAIHNNPLMNTDYVQTGRQILESYIENLSSKDRKVMLHNWYIEDHLSQRNGRYALAHGIVTGHTRLPDSIFCHTSKIRETYVNEEDELVILTMNTEYHCPLNSCDWNKQDQYPDMISDYEKIKAEYKDKDLRPVIEPGKVLLVLSNFSHYYFHSLYCIPEGADQPCEYSGDVHVGMFQDSYLIEADHGRIDLRYFPHFQNIEFYSEHTQGMPLFLENVGDVTLYAKSSVGTIKLNPGERKEVRKENAETETTSLPNGDLYPAGIIE